MKIKTCKVQESFKVGTCVQQQERTNTDYVLLSESAAEFMLQEDDKLKVVGRGCEEDLRSGFDVREAGVGLAAAG